jgi:hypothetical protein
VKRLRRYGAACLLVVPLLCVAVIQPQAALADGDPASDYFPTVDIFVPLDPPPATNLQKDLDNLVFAAKRRGYVVKVAVIGSRTDLGAVPQLFGKPGTYAKFLGAEIRTFYTGRLLIVMPQGIGGRNVPASELRALRNVTIAAGSSDELVRTGMAAVRAGAAAAGVELPVLPPTPAGVTTSTPVPTVHSTASADPASSTSSSSSSSSATVILVAAGAACLVLTAGGAVFARWKQSDEAPDAG